MNQTAEETSTAAGVRLHWTYRVLRTIAYIALATVFWAWVIFLALSGRF